MATNVVRTCSWCHKANRIGRPPTYCAGCGHRADLPRAACDCAECRRRREGPSEVGETLEALMARLPCGAPRSAVSSRPDPDPERSGGPEDQTAQPSPLVQPDGAC
jgi:hypothetical protein